MKRCFLFVGWLLPSIVLANGAAFIPGRDGAGIIPIQENRIQMVEEEVRIDASAAEPFESSGLPGEQSKYLVFCRFSLKNLKNAKVPILMGFPFKDGQGEEVLFKASVDGVDVPVAKKDSVAGYGFAYTWKVSFDRLQEKTILCTYQGLWSASLMDGIGEKYTLTYITHTGRLWAGAIKKADFYVRLSNKASIGVVINKRKMKVGYSATPQDYVWDPVRREVIFHRTNWKPKPPLGDKRYNLGLPLVSEDDINVLFFSLFCSSFEEYYSLKDYDGDRRLYSSKDLDHPYINKGGDLDYSEEGSREWSIKKRFYLTLLRNEILARHGQTFNDPQLKEVFERCPWYVPRGEVCPESLSAIEKQNVQIIDQEAAKAKTALRSQSVKFSDLTWAFQRSYRGATRLYDENDLKPFHEDDEKNRLYARLLKNEIYARHGHIFQTAIKDFFAAQPWYKSQQEVRFDDLSEIEKKNVLFITQYMISKGWD